MATLEEKRAMREAAKKAAGSVRPPAPKAAPITEPPAGVEEKKATPAPKAEPEPAAVSAPAPVTAPEPAAPAAGSKVLVPKSLKTVKPKPAPVAPAPVAAAKPKMAAPDPDVFEPVSGSEVLDSKPASLAGTDLSALEAPDEPTPVATRVAAPDPAPKARKSDPPVQAPPKPQAEAPKQATVRMAFKREDEARRVGPAMIEYNGSAGPDAVKAKVTAYGKETDVVLTKGEEQSVKATAADGSELSVTLMFSGANVEGDKEVHADVIEVKPSKPKKGPGFKLSSLKRYIPEFVTGTFAVALATTALAVADIRVWMEQNMGGWRWPAVIGVPLVMLGIAVYSAVEEYRKVNKKEA